MDLEISALQEELVHLNWQAEYLYNRLLQAEDMPAGPEREFHYNLSGDLFDITVRECEEKEAKEVELKWELQDLEVRLWNNKRIL